ncbi:hypothetical protein EDB87DRAFT_1822248 [Lactarius vividus]|nr:hypothetical protein EDB87DRAFT_1822248 [Lactarius vividus]
MTGPSALNSPNRSHDLENTTHMVAQSHDKTLVETWDKIMEKVASFLGSPFLVKLYLAELSQAEPSYGNTVASGSRPISTVLAPPVAMRQRATSRGTTGEPRALGGCPVHLRFGCVPSIARFRFIPGSFLGHGATGIVPVWDFSGAEVAQLELRPCDRKSLPSVKKQVAPPIKYDTVAISSEDALICQHGNKLFKFNTYLLVF